MNKSMSVLNEGRYLEATDPSKVGSGILRVLDDVCFPLSIFKQHKVIQSFIYHKDWEITSLLYSGRRRHLLNVDGSLFFIPPQGESIISLGLGNAAYQKVGDRHFLIQRDAAFHLSRDGDLHLYRATPPVTLGNKTIVNYNSAGDQFWAVFNDEYDDGVPCQVIECGPSVQLSFLAIGEIILQGELSAGKD